MKRMEGALIPVNYNVVFILVVVFMSLSEVSGLVDKFCGLSDIISMEFFESSDVPMESDQKEVDGDKDKDDKKLGVEYTKNKALLHRLPLLHQIKQDNQFHPDIPTTPPELVI